MGITGLILISVAAILLAIAWRMHNNLRSEKDTDSPKKEGPKLFLHAILRGPLAIIGSGIGALGVLLVILAYLKNMG